MKIHSLKFISLFLALSVIPLVITAFVIFSTMEELSKGNLQIVIPESKRKDEIGLLSNAMLILKNNFEDAIRKVS